MLRTLFSGRCKHRAKCLQSGTPSFRTFVTVLAYRTRYIPSCVSHSALTSNNVLARSLAAFLICGGKKEAAKALYLFSAPLGLAAPPHPHTPPARADCAPSAVVLSDVAVLDFRNRSMPLGQPIPGRPSRSGKASRKLEMGKSENFMQL